MVNYQNGKIYKLVNNVDDEIYVGSTTTSLSRRKGGHVDKAKYYPNRKLYKHLLEIGWSNIRIILLESYSCKNKDELAAREQFWIDKLKPTLNMDKAMETTTDRTIRIKNKNKKRYEKNKEQILNDNKIYRDSTDNYKKKITCVCGNVVSNGGLSRHKKRQHHLQWVKDNNYIEPKKEKTDWKKTVVCECGASLKLETYICSRHKKSKNHLFWEKEYNYIYS